ncbi:MAG: helix-turn-helix domain-containing protein [Myxococcota bacterium]
MRFHERQSDVAGIDACWAITPGPALDSLVAADGSVDVVVWLGEGGPALHVERATVEAFHVPLSARDEVLGVRLRPGHGEPLRALETDLAVEVARAWRRGQLTSRLLEQLVAERLRSPPAVINDFVHLATTSSGRFVLSGRSERALQRAAKHWLGTRPKTFLRITRAQAASRALSTGEAIVDVAHRLGFSDQAHLTRELRTLLGRTPATLHR